MGQRDNLGSIFGFQVSSIMLLLVSCFFLVLVSWFLVIDHWSLGDENFIDSVILSFCHSAFFGLPVDVA